MFGHSFFSGFWYGAEFFGPGAGITPPVPVVQPASSTPGRITRRQLLDQFKGLAAETDAERLARRIAAGLIPEPLTVIEQAARALDIPARISPELQRAFAELARAREDTERFHVAAAELERIMLEDEEDAIMLLLL